MKRTAVFNKADLVLSAHNHFRCAGCSKEVVHAPMTYDPGPCDRCGDLLIAVNRITHGR